VGGFAYPWRVIGSAPFHQQHEWRFFAIGTALEYFRPRPRKASGAKKGRKQLTSLNRSFVAITAAIFMSTVAVGAAVGPAQAAGVTSQVAANA